MDNHTRLSKFTCKIASPTNSLSSLQLFYDTIESHIRGLKALGTTEESYGTMLIPIIMSRLPTEIRTNIACEYGNTAWTIDQLKDAVQKETGVLESVLPGTSQSLTMYVEVSL